MAAVIFGRTDSPGDLVRFSNSSSVFCGRNNNRYAIDCLWSHWALSSTRWVACSEHLRAVTENPSALRSDLQTAVRLDQAEQAPTRCEASRSVRLPDTAAPLHAAPDLDVFTVCGIQIGRASCRERV